MRGMGGMEGMGEMRGLGGMEGMRGMRGMGRMGGMRGMGGMWGGKRGEIMNFMKKMKRNIY
jgi:hypothetical protein